jgi:hypothetical protein
MKLAMKNNTKRHQILDYHCKGVVIDIPVCEQCYSLFGGESAFDYTPEAEISFVFEYTTEISFSFDYTPESEIRFEKSCFHLSNGDRNV